MRWRVCEAPSAAVAAQQKHLLVPATDDLWGVLPAVQLAPGGISWAVNERQGEALIRASEALQRVQGSIAGGLPRPAACFQPACGSLRCLAFSMAVPRLLCPPCLQTSCPWTFGRSTCGRRCWRWGR